MFLSSWKMDKKEGISSFLPTLQELGNRECLYVFLEVIVVYGVFHKVNLFSKLCESCSFLLVNKRRNHPLYLLSRIGCRNCLCVFSLVSWMIMESSIELTTSLNHGKNPFFNWVHKRENWYVYGIMEHVVEVNME